MVKALTYRVEGIPPGTTKAGFITEYVDAEDQTHVEVKSLFPNHESAGGRHNEVLTATVIFRSRLPRPEGPRIRMLEVDKDFVGFTPLYVPPEGKGPIVADIIAVTGLAGHAFGSWAHCDESMWLRDYLPRYADNARILTYGYPSELNHNQSFSTLQDYTSEFVQRLVHMRAVAKCESRPIIFIGHSLGCLIIKKTVAETAMFGTRLPIRTVIFLAAPHRGLHINALRELAQEQPSEMLIRELEPGSPSLRELSRRFASCVQDIDILTCFETKMTKTITQNADGQWERNGPLVMMVTPESAILDHPKEQNFPAHSDHSQIAKVTQAQAGILSRIGKAIKDGLRSMVGIGEETNQDLDPDIHKIPSESSAGKRSLPRPSESNLVCVNEEKPVSTCKGCSNPIPDLMFHFRCKSCKYHGDESNCFCQDRYDPCFLCDKHLENLTKTWVKSRLGFHHYVDYLDIQVSNSDPTIMTAVKTNNPDNLRRELKDPLNRRIMYAGDVKGCTPLHWAALLGHAECLHVLLDSYAPKNGRNKANNTSLMLAIEYDHIQAVRILLEHNVNIDSIGGHHSSTALCSAARHGQSDVVGLLLQHGAAVELQHHQSITALHYAAHKGDAESVLLLFEAGAQPNVKDRFGYTPLHTAAAGGHAKTIELLLSKGANLDELDNLAQTPLHIAIKSRRSAATKALLAANAKVDTKDVHGNTLLHIAADSNPIDLIQLLVERDVNVNGINKNGHTPLLIAGIKGRIKSCELLVNVGADIHVVLPNDGRDILMLAVFHAAPELIKFLLNNGAVVGHKDHKWGYTALHWAAAVGNDSSCRALLGSSASPDLLAGFASNTPIGAPTPMFLAVFHGHQRVVELFLEHGVAPNCYFPSGSFPLHLAACQGMTRICQILLDRGAAVYQETLDGYENNAVMAAASSGHIDTLKLLLENRASGVCPPSRLKRSWSDLPFLPGVSKELRRAVRRVLREDTEAHA